MNAIRILLAVFLLSAGCCGRARAQTLPDPSQIRDPGQLRDCQLNPYDDRTGTRIPICQLAGACYIHWGRLFFPDGTFIDNREIICKYVHGWLRVIGDPVWSKWWNSLPH